MIAFSVFFFRFRIKMKSDTVNPESREAASIRSWKRIVQNIDSVREKLGKSDTLSLAILVIRTKTQTSVINITKRK